VIGVLFSARTDAVRSASQKPGSLRATDFHLFRHSPFADTEEIDHDTCRGDTQFSRTTVFEAYRASVVWLVPVQGKDPE
jgi:hypothetical protein